MNRKYYLFVILLSPFLLLAQSLSVLTHPDYLNNPVNYLSKISQSKIESNILIDRIFFDEIVMNVNGKSKVSTLSTSKWAKIYQHLKYASYDTTGFLSFKQLTEVRDLIYQRENAYPIAIMDYQFNKVSQSSLDNGQLKQENTYLNDYSANINSFFKERVVAASCLHRSIYGNQIDFYIDDMLMFSNNTTQKLEAISIDFGNGQGFQDVVSKQVVSVNYTSSIEHINMVVKLTFRNIQTNELEVLYSHSTVLRKGSNAFSFNNQTINNENNVSNVIDKLTNDERFAKPNFYGRIEYNVLYSPQNIEKKQLRKPFIVCDGFDPGNKRDYFAYNFDIDASELLPKQQDNRGLYELIDGVNSPWYTNDEQVNLISYLQNEGYDLVVVNFLDGAGDVIKNGEEFRGFLNEVINNPTYRNNQTEEAVLVGPSMGGLITRYALTTMEKNKEEHYTKMWISFDSPHKGADIPVALQYLMEFGEDLSSAFEKGKDALHSSAAKQMLLSRNRSEFTDLYSKLDLLGYPKSSKNFAISNGGISKLYNQDGGQIIDLNVTVKSALNMPNWISNNLAVSDNILLKAKGNGTKNNQDSEILDASKINFINLTYTSKKITQKAFSHENAPGGWHSGLYLVNYSDANINKKFEYFSNRDSHLPYTKATFISTTSAFGVDVTPQTIHKNHTDFTASQTPFDEIHGMQTNEEHVRISASTRDYLLNQLHNEFDDTQRPRVRNNEIVNETVSGEVAYSAKKIVFGTNDASTFTVKNTADINIIGSELIEFLPGFSTENGSKMKANINSLKTHSSIARKSIVQRQKFDYSQPSPFIGKTYDYSNDQENPVLMDQKAIAQVSPNPFQDNISLTIQSNGSEISTNEKITIQFYDVIGNKVMEKELYSNELKNMNVSQLSNGIYFVHIIIPHYEMITTKIVKI